MGWAPMGSEVRAALEEQYPSIALPLSAGQPKCGTLLREYLKGLGLGGTGRLGHRPGSRGPVEGRRPGRGCHPVWMEGQRRGTGESLGRGMSTST